MRIKQLAYAIGMIGIATSVGFAHAAEEASSTEKIEITGSSIKRRANQGSLPVQVMTKEEISRSGATSTEQLLASISAISSAGGTTNSTGAGSSTYGLSSISLRGLDSDRTLVLVNGRRVAAFAGGGGATVNVNSIPLSAIERVEVLKDGASGVYGSDAIAGVVNFILSKNFKGVELGAQAGQSTRDGGGDSEKYSIVAGFGSLDDHGFNITVAGSFEKEDVLKARDREFAKSGNVLPYFTNGATGQGNIEGVWVNGDRHPTLWGTSPASGYGNPAAVGGKCASIQMFNAGTTSKGGPYCAYDSAPDVGLVPDRELTNFAANFSAKLGENLSFFGDALWSESVVKQSFQANPIRNSFLVTDSLFGAQGVDAALLMKPTNPNYQIAADYLNSIGAGALVGQTLAVTSRTLGFGGRKGEDKSEQSRFVAGLRGNFASQDFEVAYSVNKSETNSRVTDGYFSQVAYAKIINDTNSWNPWAPDGIGNASVLSALKGAAYVGPSLSAESTSDVFDGKISGDLFDLGDRPVQYAAGFQHRKEEYVTRPSAALETGDIAGLGGSVPPVNRDRNVRAFFGEVVVPVLSNLEANLSIRNDRYNDVGSANNYKAALRWNPTRAFMVRASAGTGFRAPTLTDLWQPQSLGTSEQFTYKNPKDGTVNEDVQVNSLTGGNPGLRPEESEQSSIGFQFSPNSKFTIGVDLWNVKVEDILSTPSAQETVSGFLKGDSAYAGKVTLDANGDVQSIIQTLANVGSAKVSGVDLDLAYRDSFSFGRIEVALNGTYMSKFDQTSPGGFLSHKVGTIVEPDGNPVLDADEGGVVLRWKHALSANWSTGPWAAGITQNFYKRYQAGNDLNGDQVHVPSQAIYDLSLAYSGVKGLKLGLGVKNLFDRDPPIFVPVSNQFQYGYDISLYDPRARFVYLNASYKFF